MTNAVFPTQGVLFIYQEILVGMLFKFFLLYLLHKTRVAMRFPAKNTSSRLWCGRTGGWTKGRKVTSLKVTTKISQMHR